MAKGYYNIEETQPRVGIGFKENILRCRSNPVIAEIKSASPSIGVIAEDIDVENVAKMMRRGGASALSILTEPKNFRGRIEHLQATRNIGLPRLMKDIIIEPAQVEAAAKAGAEAILLITSIFQRRLSETKLDDMISLAHKRGLEVLLETHTTEEFQTAVNTQADMIGINNRDLSTMTTDIQVTVRIMTRCKPRGKVIVSESGIATPEHIRLLRRHGVDAFLVGSSIMTSPDIEGKVRELVEA
ncbi:indole-3-glycerol-phosphate synthase [Candidatus Bathyarchaeota archaeon]|nr:indole-3-glycerol-phosphate synthase [Candidatus Bathyarchaeota archaeon]MBS7629232.1 indole-3-glycerol-phosphate synthase [Candidatus Bathyarchaeota archaeon]